MMRLSEQTDKLFPALFKVKQELGPVTKNATNPHFKSKFADLNAHIELVEPILAKHGLMILQPPSGNDNGSNSLVTMIIHSESGQYLSSSLNLTNVPDMQKTLAGITYARRGSINSLFGLASEDDDGETAVGRGTSEVKEEKKETKKAASKTASSSFSKPSGFSKPVTNGNATTQPTEGGW